MTPDELRARVLYCDAHVLVIDKPAGMPVHGGPRARDHLEALLPWLRFGFRQPPMLAHRLDRDTSGCLVLGRHRKAVRRLMGLFAAGSVEKVYWAVVDGVPPHEDGVVDLPLRKRSGPDGWRMEADPSGQRALTAYRLLGQGAGRSWLELRPRTGRTHQIRVHCAALGCPVHGDPVYGTSPAVDAPLHLHSRAVVIPYAGSCAPIRVEAPPPAHMLGALGACGFDPDDAGRIASTAARMAT